jgi:hypothetical protein
VKNRIRKQDEVEIIPDEIDYENMRPLKHKENRIKKTLGVRNGYVYGYTNGYRDKSIYYQPGYTYREMPKITPQFKLNVTIKNIDEEVLELKSRNKLKSILEELEKELYQLMLFDEQPKYANEEEVNSKYHHAYYDPTTIDRKNRIKKLKQKIIALKEKLGLSKEVGFVIEVKNSTFPHTSSEVLDYYENRHTDMLDHSVHSEKINGDYSNLDDVYEKRQAHLKSNDDNHKQTSKFLSLKLPYNNQILEYIRKKNINKNKKRI